ncbi:MAG TPA: peptide chain release factor N(5)-glutamine methyltransferase [Accumulibacter sp.]|jgi:release factor glutamine methyltransferase|nr:peptide chain release factor N(5)-glutamine methyltransferase [Accumulibacter sp.]HQC79936.1 peptide chain release factor N(5)-glutamine methyltransferase [Accumulibacter sp.]
MRPTTPAIAEAMPAGIGDAWRAARQRIDRLDARLLVEHVAACTHAELLAHPERLLSAAQTGELAALVARRARGEPLAYLLRSAGFHGLEFAVTPDVLIPRPETERLVELALERLPAVPAPRIVDLGTGSGILAITLARHCPQATVTAVDLSPAALDVARANAARHGVAVRFCQGDWYLPLGDARFDLIVANPPYVADGDPHLRGDGLPYEPRMALTDGQPGGDGLACIQAIVADSGEHLAPGGWLLLEHGYDQADAVRELLRAHGLVEIASWRDLGGIERVSGGRSR